MKAWKKKRNNAGFSLAELLVTILILMMVSALVAAGLPAAREAYLKVVDSANAQTLLSTTATMLRAELCEASGVQTDVSGNVQSYRSPRTRAKTVLSCEGGEGIRVRDYADNEPAEWRQLVSSEAATDTLHTTYDSIKYSNGVFTISNLRVIRGGETVSAALETLSIRTVNP